jgi:integrase
MKNRVQENFRPWPENHKRLDRLRAVAVDEWVVPAKSVKRVLNTACRRAGMAPMSHHDFRHLFATRCIESGVDMPTVARWLGHRDGGALLSKVYFHLADSHSRRMALTVCI